MITIFPVFYRLYTSLYSCKHEFIFYIFLSFSLCISMDFYRYLCNLAKQIPPGRISTYTHLARALGDTRAKKAVKETLETSHDSTSIPWYRVIEDNGKIETEKKKTKIVPIL